MTQTAALAVGADRSRGNRHFTLLRTAMGAALVIGMVADKRAPTAFGAIAVAPFEPSRYRYANGQKQSKG
jgi:hypothetical protein